MNAMEGFNDLASSFGDAGIMTHSNAEPAIG
jgi:hypothetical protein